MRDAARGGGRCGRASWPDPIRGAAPSRGSPAPVPRRYRSRRPERRSDGAEAPPPTGPRERSARGAAAGTRDRRARDGDDLERDESPEPLVDRAVDGAHAAPADHFLDPVSAAENAADEEPFNAHGDRSSGCDLRLDCSYEFPVSSFQFPVSGFQFPVSSFRFPVSSFQFPVSSFQFPVSSFQLSVCRLPAIGFPASGFRIRAIRAPTSRFRCSGIQRPTLSVAGCHSFVDTSCLVNDPRSIGGRDRLPTTGNWQLATGNWQPATGNRQPATGNLPFSYPTHTPLHRYPHPRRRPGGPPRCGGSGRGRRCAWERRAEPSP